MIGWEIKKMAGTKSFIAAWAVFIFCVLASSFIGYGQASPGLEFYGAISRRMTHPAVMVSMICMIILIFSNIYVEERISGVDSLILSSLRKPQVLKAKMSSALILTTASYLLLIASQALIASIQYGAGAGIDLNATLISGGVLIPGSSISIGDYIWIKGIVAYVVLISASVLTVLSSLVSSTSIGALSMIFSFLGMGKVISIMDFIPGKIAYLLSFNNYCDVTLGLESLLSMHGVKVEVFGQSLSMTDCTILIFASITTIGIITFVYLCKRWI